MYVNVTFNVDCCYDSLQQLLRIYNVTENSDKLFCTTENIALCARFRYKRCRYKRARMY